MAAIADIQGFAAELLDQAARVIQHLDATCLVIDALGDVDIRSSLTHRAELVGQPSCS
jgi:hypothetical protein